MRYFGYDEAHLLYHKFYVIDVTREWKRYPFVKVQQCFFLDIGKLYVCPKTVNECTLSTICAPFDVLKMSFFLYQCLYTLMLRFLWPYLIVG